MVASQTAEADHKEEAVQLEEKIKINQTTSKKNIEKTKDQYYKKVRENSFKWLKFNNRFAHNIAKNGIFIPFKLGHRKRVLKKLTKFPYSRKHSRTQTNLISEEINKLVKLNIVSKNKYKRIYPNQVFIVKSEDRTTKNRLIFDMSELNKSINLRKFTMTKLSDIIPHIFENNYAATFDLSKAYYHVPINPKYKKFFSFKFQSDFYNFNSMPFGLSTAPYIFSKFISPVLEYLRKNFNIQIFSYIDDFLLLAKSADQLKLNINISLELFKSLGFLINFEKSIITPSTKITFLGVKFDLKNNKMSNTSKLISKVIMQAKELQSLKFINRHMLERFIGLGNFMSS